MARHRCAFFAGRLRFRCHCESNVIRPLPCMCRDSVSAEFPAVTLPSANTTLASDAHLKVGLHNIAMWSHTNVSPFLHALSCLRDQQTSCVSACCGATHVRRLGLRPVAPPFPSSPSMMSRSEASSLQGGEPSPRAHCRRWCGPLARLRLWGRWARPCSMRSASRWWACWWPARPPAPRPAAPTTSDASAQCAGPRT